jgi:hypothetical protein
MAVLIITFHRDGRQERLCFSTAFVSMERFGGRRTRRARIANNSNLEGGNQFNGSRTGKRSDTQAEAPEKKTALKGKEKSVGEGGYEEVVSRPFLI